MKKETIFEIQLLNGAQLPVTVTAELRGEHVLVHSEIYGKHFEVKKIENQLGINIGYPTWTKIREQISRHVPQVGGIKNKLSLHFRVTTEEVQRLKRFKEEFTKDYKAQAEAKKTERIKAEAEQPRCFGRWSFLDWGDYSIKMERRIVELRRDVEDQGAWVVEKIIVNLDDSRISGHHEEWEAMPKEDVKIIGLVPGIVKMISAEEAEKWIKLGEEVSEKEAQEKAEKERLEAERKAKKEAERQAKFDQAKATGKPVLLSQHFLSYSEIPRRFRDEDSDMGTLYVYAMPDGSTKEEFSHAY